MTVVPNLTADLARVLGLDLTTAGEVQRIVAQTFNSRATRKKKTPAACRALGTVLALDEDRTLSVFFTVHDMVRRAMEFTDVAAHDAFLYDGPIDGVMRPFCREHVGKVYSLERIKTLSNGQLTDVHLTAGGWECRHVWTAVGRFSDLAKLANTGRRLPEVEDALADLARNPPPADWTADRPSWCSLHNCPGPFRG